MKKYIAAILLFSLTSYSFACEPASIDWELFYKNYDLEKNKNIDKNEFAHVQGFIPYSWPTNKDFQGLDKNRKLFNFLDKDKNKQLTNTELGELYSVLPNPCAGWPWKS